MSGAPPHWRFSSALPGLAWPAIPTPRGNALLALLFQLERTERLSAARLRELQFTQLASLARHAYGTTRFYRGHWGRAYDPEAPLTPERFAALPLLSRRELQSRYEELKSSAVPKAHGPVSESRTSGSSGTPVRILLTGMTGLYWRALTLREHAWHRRNLQGTLAVIRRRASRERTSSWGAATHGLLKTGPAIGLGVRESLDAQLQWLADEKPEYLLTYPSLVAALAKASLERGLRLPGLREVRTLGELLSPEARELCRGAWDVPLTDMYSAQEVGYIALQCPGQEHYHAQSESVLVEVLDDGGRPCRPGEVGRVVVTSLHNAATPLVRYDLGDYAEAGEPCSCGRGLPVLKRIVGRVRNMFVTASGERFWPSFPRRMMEVAAVLQHQFIQKEFDLVEARLVSAAPFTAAQEASLREMILARLPAGTRLAFRYVERIERSAGGKYEDFKSEVAAG